MQPDSFQMRMELYREIERQVPELRKWSRKVGWAPHRKSDRPNL